MGVGYRYPEKQEGESCENMTYACLKTERKSATQF
jgi:hypothetical protein